MKPGYYFVRFDNGTKQEREPMDLAAISLICRICQVTAFLFSDEGFRLGTVYPSGEAYLG